jgi:two-component system sensor histidine kinase HydH
LRKRTVENLRGEIGSLAGPKKFQAGIVFSAILGITLFHYSIGINPFIHQVYGEFYFIPILLSALWFGLKGGILASVLVDVLLLPHFFIAWGSTALGLWSVLLEAPALNLAGLVIGYLSDRRWEGRKLAEERGEYLVSMGKNYSFAAHEMKNIGIVIHGFASLLHRKSHLSGEATKYLGVIEEESLRLERMAKGLLNFLAPPVMKKERLDLNEFLKGVTLLAGEAGREKGIEFQSEIPEGLPCIWMDADMVKEVLFNLLRNAVQATPPGGRVILKVSESRTLVKFQIADTGKGIPAEEIKKIFLPFYTTKADGNGLGLALSKKIIAAHGAALDVESQVGKGTQFTLLFPLERGE